MSTQKPTHECFSSFIPNCQNTEGLKISWHRCITGEGTFDMELIEMRSSKVCGNVGKVLIWV
jgi:hypothetical protein